MSAKTLASSKSTKRAFSTIYVEQAAQNYSDTAQVLARFPRSKVIHIDSYKEILNRSKQNWRVQKDSQSIILAKRHDEFLYKGTNIAPNFSHKHFYYNTLTLNCVYNCHYCYLQGMYPSAHTVLFVNNDDYLRATKERLKELGSMYLCISYDTDLLAFEDILPQSKRWIAFAKENQNLTIELRTKSTNISSLKSIEPKENCIVAFTLSPEEIVKRYETGTPALSKRLGAIAELAQRGWRLRICIDPVLVVPRWQEMYSQLVEQIFSHVSADAIADITVGTFRMPERYYKETKKIRMDSPLFHEKELSKDHSIIGYNYGVKAEVKAHVGAVLDKFYPKGQVEWVLSS